MRSNVQIHPPTRLMPLHQLMPAKGILPGLDLIKLPRRSRFPTMPQTVRRNIVLRQQLPLELLIEILKSLSRVCEVRVPARPVRWQRVRSQQRETSPPRVEARVHVEQRVALAEVVTFRVKLGNGAVVLEVRDIEDLVMR